MKKWKKLSVTQYEDLFTDYSIPAMFKFKKLYEFNKKGIYMFSTFIYIQKKNTEFVVIEDFKGISNYFLFAYKNNLDKRDLLNLTLSLEYISSIEGSEDLTETEKILDSLIFDDFYIMQGLNILHG